MLSDIDKKTEKKFYKALYRGKCSPFKRCIDCLSQKAFDNRELAIIDNALSAKPVFKIKKLNC